MTDPTLGFLLGYPVVKDNSVPANTLQLVGLTLKGKEEKVAFGFETDGAYHAILDFKKRKTTPIKFIVNNNKENIEKLISLYVVPDDDPQNITEDLDDEVAEILRGILKDE